MPDQKGNTYPTEKGTILTTYNPNAKTNIIIMLQIQTCKLILLCYNQSGRV